MTRNLYLLLGLPEFASFTDVKRQYLKLSGLLASQAACGDPLQQKRLRMARERLSQTYEEFKKASIRKAYNGDFLSLKTPGHRSIAPSTRPRIGQILVAAGVLAIEELDEALEVQQMSEIPIPLGRLLVSWRYLSWEELAYYLKLQDLIRLPPDNPSRLAKQLLELGLVSEDQLAITRLDLRNGNLGFCQALVRRKWISKELLEQMPFKTRLPSLRTIA